LQLARWRDAAHLAQVHPDEVDQALRDQGAPFEGVVEQLTLRQRDGGFVAQLPEPFPSSSGMASSRKNRSNGSRARANRMASLGLQPFVHVMAELHLKAHPAADGIEQLDRVAHVLPRVQIDAVEGALRRLGWRFGMAAPAVAAALAADMGDALGAVFLDVVAQLVQIPAVGVPVDGHALATFAAKQLVQGHPGQLALDVPQRHVNAGDGVVLDRAIAPVGILVHQLPKLFDRMGIARPTSRGLRYASIRHLTAKCR